MTSLRDFSPFLRCVCKRPPLKGVLLSLCDWTARNGSFVGFFLCFITTLPHTVRRTLKACKAANLADLKEWACASQCRMGLSGSRPFKDQGPALSSLFLAIYPAASKQQVWLELFEMYLLFCRKTRWRVWAARDSLFFVVEHLLFHCNRPTSQLCVGGFSSQDGRHQNPPPPITFP